MQRRTIIEQPHSPYRYHLINTKRSSEHYGDCTVCDKPVGNVYHQIEERRYQRTSDGKMSWTHKNCFDAFGHLECLADVRRLQ